MCRLAVQGIAHRIEIPQPLKRICNLQQRTVAVIPQAAKYLFWCRAKVHNGPALVEMLPVLGTQHGPATSRHNAGRASREFIKDRGLNVPKTVLPFPLKELADRTAQSLFNHVVRVKKGQ